MKWNEISAPYSNEDHGGAIFLSRSSDTPSAAYTHHIYIHHNYFHDGSQGDFIYIGDGSRVDDVYIYNNIFNSGSSDAGTSGAIFPQTGSQNQYVYNNLFYKVAAPGASVSNACVYASAPNSSTQIRTTNNICYGLPNQTMYTKESGGSWTSTNELFYNPSGSATFGGTITRNNALLNLDPQLVVDGGSFSLQSSSPARAAGANLFSTMNTLPWGAFDYEGKPYPATGAWDLGPVQF